MVGGADTVLKVSIPLSSLIGPRSGLPKLPRLLCILAQNGQKFNCSFLTLTFTILQRIPDRTLGKSFLGGPVCHIEALPIVSRNQNADSEGLTFSIMVVLGIAW